MYPVLVGVGSVPYVELYVACIVSVSPLFLFGNVPSVPGFNVTVYVLDVAFATNTVFAFIVTVVFFVPAFAGFDPLVFSHVDHVYPALTVASMLTCFPLT